MDSDVGQLDDDQAAATAGTAAHRPWCQVAEHEAAGDGGQCHSRPWEWSGITAWVVGDPAPDATVGDLDVQVITTPGGVTIPASRRAQVAESFELWLAATVGKLSAA